MGEPAKEPDRTIPVVLGICVLAAMAQGGRGIVSASSSTDDGSQGTSHVRVVNASSFDGTLRIRTTACQQIKGTQQVRYDVKGAQGQSVASITRPMEPEMPNQQVNAGRALPPGRYTITVTCLSDGQPVGDFRTATVDVGNQPSNARTGGQTPNRDRLPLPHTGR